MKLYDKVITTQEYEKQREVYPLYPDFQNQIGTIIEVIFSDIAKIETNQNDEHFGKQYFEAITIYRVRFNQPFKIGIVPDKETAYNYQPTEFREDTEFVFTEEQLEKI